MRYGKLAAAVGAVALAGGFAVVGYGQRSVWTFKLIDEKTAAAAAASPGDTPVQLWHCGMHPQVIQDHPGFCPICHMALTPMSAGHDTTHGAGHGAGGITIDPAVVQNMGLRTAIAERGRLQSSVQTAGMLKIPEPAMWDIVPKTSGWITHLYADTEGMHVHKGDLLFTYSSPDVQEAEAELIQALRTFKTTSDWDPTRRNAAKVALDTARRKCVGLGLDDAAIAVVTSSQMVPDSIGYRSPASGAVSEKNIVQGSSIWSGMKVMRIEEHSMLWLDTDVFENQMASIAVGDSITARFDAIPGRSFAGKVSFVFPHVEAMTRAEMVRGMLDNPELILKPGMYATVRIQTQPAAEAVIVPCEAVIDTGTHQVAFVELPGGHFDSREVRVGLRGDDDRVQILSGISAGESVVTSGQFLLDVESRTIEAIDKLREKPVEMMHPAMDQKMGMP